MNTKFIISCLAASALLIGGCSHQQANKPPPGNGPTGPVSDGQGGGSPGTGYGNNSNAGGSKNAGNGGSGTAAGSGSSTQTGGSGLNVGQNGGSGSGVGNVFANGSGQGNNSAYGGQNQGGFGSGSAYGGNAGNGYTPADLRDPNSILAQRIIYFEYNQAGIKPEYRRVLDAHGSLLTDFPQLKVRLEGHADERGSREYNVALSERRAFSVRDYLKIKGVNAGQTDIVGYGEEVPATFGHGENSWSRNRRVEIIYAGE